MSRAVTVPTHAGLPLATSLAVCASRRARAGAIVLAVAACLVLGLAPNAEAQDVAAAAAAFQRAQQAQLRGEPAEAARFYEMADAAAPSPEALRSAIRMHQEAGNAARAATLALEARRRHPDDAACATLAAEVLLSAEPLLGRLTIRCATACTLLIDGRAASTDARDAHELFLPPGVHSIGARWARSPEGASGGEVSREVTLTAGGREELALEAPAVTPEPLPTPTPPPDPAPMPEPTPAPGGGGIHPALFGVGLALTAIAGGFVIGSGLDTLAARDAYVAAPTREGYEDGLTREWRTNGLIIVTLALAATTLLLAIFTDWDGEPSPMDVAIGPDGASVSARGTF